MSDLIILLTILVITWVSGSVIEKNHFKKIKQREIALIRKPVVSYGIKKWSTNRKIKKVELVCGECVVSGDYFKSFVAGLKNFFGGRLTTYESILDRGRREAVLRMRESAKGANFIVNTRVETVVLNPGQEKNTIPQCAMIAYGTAITYEN